MNEQKRITRRGLLDKVKLAAESDLVVEWMAVKTAQALGYEVVEEPELPERLRLSVGTEAYGLYAPHNPPGALNPEDVVGTMHFNPGPYSPAGVASELVLRYNAKAAVLAVAEELEERRTAVASMWPRSEMYGLMAARLRAAYENNPTQKKEEA